MNLIHNPIWPSPGQPPGLIFPAHQITAARYQQALACLPALGVENYREYFTAEAFVSQGQAINLAGPDDWRAKMMNDAAGRPGLIWAVRGGFGSSRLLPRINWRAWLDPRPCLLGFSDITALLLHLANMGLVSLHGPTLSQTPYLDQASRDDLYRLLAGRALWPQELSGRVIEKGSAQGVLLGGNLTLLCHLLGTAYEPRLEGAVLFLEEANEAPYCLDRYLTKLELAGIPDKITAVALGGLWGYYEKISVEECEQRRDLVFRRLRAWGKPFLADLPFGHGQSNRLLPVGAEAALEGGRLTVGISCGTK
ncbi:MAG: LD-carboxypeptidase [Desulfarculales bacterium]|jgi:muramoyltetrapeptide carboxypeptidase|nr:LD-carboxypeptidase [Desulfarculales bacterium]